MRRRAVRQAELLVDARSRQREVECLRHARRICHLVDNDAPLLLVLERADYGRSRHNRDVVRRIGSFPIGTTGSGHDPTRHRIFNHLVCAGPQVAAVVRRSAVRQAELLVDLDARQREVERLAAARRVCHLVDKYLARRNHIHRCHICGVDCERHDPLQSNGFI